jgi:Flp pilus assembly CpaE family ATPase
MWNVAGSYFADLDPQQAIWQALRTLERLDYIGTLTPIITAA